MTFLWSVILLSPLILCQGAKLSISPGVNPLQKPAGQQISLLCTVDKIFSDARPGLLWKKNGIFVSAANAEISKLDPFTLSLTIRNASPEDSGVYLCQAQLQNGTLLQRTVDVVVFEDYHFVDKTTSTGTVMATAAVNISCEVYPKRETFNTVWARPGQPKWTPGGKHRLYKGGAILEISDYEPQQDAGDYNCKVTDPVTGVSLVRKIVVGSEQENKRMFCTNMCTNVCHQLYQAPVF